MSLAFLVLVVACHINHGWLTNDKPIILQYKQTFITNDHDNYYMLVACMWHTCELLSVHSPCCSVQHVGSLPCTRPFSVVLYNDQNGMVSVCLTECQDMFHKFLTFQLLTDPVSCILLPPSLLSSLLPFPPPFSFSFFLLSSFCQISGAVVLLLVITIVMFVYFIPNHNAL